MTSLTNSPAWKKLQTQAKSLNSIRIKGLFEEDTNRFKKMSVSLKGLIFDYSKNLITDDILHDLLSLATEQKLEDARDAMFAGNKINSTENRAVLHTALRAEDGYPEVHAVLKSIETFSNSVRSGTWLGYTGKEITDIVNIGIGGSSLGPELATEALTTYHHPRLKAHFIANVEASDLEYTLKQLNPETTLFIIASKTFTTAETMQNATLARQWFLKEAAESDIEKHFVAVSTNIDAVKDFGIATDNMFPFWDWVGGRYSIWSAIGLSVVLMVGAEAFKEFLSGAHAVDKHFKSEPLDKNIPVLMGLLGIWYRNFCDYPSYAAIPYHSQLSRLPAWLQQLDMESNGKSVDKDGNKVDYATGPITFGEPGTDAQHSFFQWLHQSPTPAPVDFITTVKPSCGTEQQQHMLLANCLAQSEALMVGKENTQEPHRHFTGNRPSNTILLDQLTPYTLGMLLTLYEHKVFVQGTIWNINSFDQWGVELGKTMAKKLQRELETGQFSEHDGSTLGLMEHIKTQSDLKKKSA